MKRGGKKLSKLEQLKIAQELLGSSLGCDTLADTYDLDLFEGGLQVKKAAEDHGVWLCDCCGWWYEESEMYELEGEMWCYDCYKENAQ
jgi:formylmethanofuran dehydrogenase subunit E